MNTTEEMTTIEQAIPAKEDMPFIRVESVPSLPDNLPKITWAYITKSLARQMMSRNRRNRKLYQRHIDTLASERVAGHWKTNGHTIVISESGDVLNGQHRLQAIIETNIASWEIVVTGVPNDAYDTIDIGRPRSVADTLTLGGERNAKRLSATLTFVGRVKAQAMAKRAFQITPVEAEELLIDNPRVRHSVEFIEKLGKAPVRFAVAAGLHYLFAEIDTTLANEFFARLTTGIGLDDGDPLLIARERILTNKIERKKYSGEYIAALLIKTWNLKRKGVSAKTLIYRASGDRAEEFPVIQ